jgi:hypothetical protein
MQTNKRLLLIVITLMLAMLGCLMDLGGNPEEISKFQDAIKVEGMKLTGNGAAVSPSATECPNESEDVYIYIPPAEGNSATGTFNFYLTTKGHYIWYEEKCDLREADDNYSWPGTGTYEYATGKLVFETCAAGGSGVAKGEAVLAKPPFGVEIKGSFECYDADGV